jgi:hypothetical protein
VLDIPPNEIQCVPEGRQLPVRMNIVKNNAPDEKFDLEGVNLEKADKKIMECVVRADDEEKEEVMAECCRWEVNGKVSKDGSRVSWTSLA